MARDGSGAAKAPRNATADGAEKNPLGRIREILQKDGGRQLEERFARVDARIRKECAAIRKESEQRVESLQQLVRDEVAALGAKLDEERGAREQALSELSRQLKELGERVRNHEQESRRLLLEHSKNLGDQIRDAHENESSARDEALLELRAGKTDRDLLANLFAEFALRLSQNDLDDGSADEDDA